LDLHIRDATAELSNGAAHLLPRLRIARRGGRVPVKDTTDSAIKSGQLRIRSWQSQRNQRFTEAIDTNRQRPAITDPSELPVLRCATS
jgi:hypothetical protein